MWQYMKFFVKIFMCQLYSRLINDTAEIFSTTCKELWSLGYDTMQIWFEKKKKTNEIDAS